MKLWFLSYSSRSPIRFVGAVVVEASSFGAAVAKAERLGIQPPGELQVQGLVVPESDGDGSFVAETRKPEYRDRLLSEEEVRSKLGWRSVREM